MKKVLIILVMLLLAVSAFARGNQESEYPRGYGRPGIDAPRAMFQYQEEECFTNGEFNYEEWLEHSPMVDYLDSDKDGIVDDTDTTIEDFVADRIGGAMGQRRQGRR